MPGDSTGARTAIVLSSGDVGSAVAHALHRDGYRVVIQDEPRPAHSRRGMAFTDALYGTPTAIEGVLAKLAATTEALVRMLECRKAIPVVAHELGAVLATVAPDLLVDARLRKRDEPPCLLRAARLTVGLGPGFVPGENVDVAVETQWGPELGRIVQTGRTRALGGEPRELSGHGRDRFVYSSVAGSFRTALDIGAHVHAGQVVGHVDAIAVTAPLTGWLRGLAHDGAHVLEGGKIVEVDVGGRHAARVLGERPRQIAAGVLAAVETRAWTVSQKA